MAGDKIRYTLPCPGAYAMKPAARRLEAGMTSDLGVEHVVERQFLFHCSCGSTIETSGKREICPDCGKTVEVVRCVPTPKGNKYTLRISKQEHGRNAEPLLLGAAAMQPARPHHEGPDHERLFRRTASTRLQRYHLQSPDYNKRYLHLGLRSSWRRSICHCCWHSLACFWCRDPWGKIGRTQISSKCQSRMTAVYSAAATTRSA